MPSASPRRISHNTLIYLLAFIAFISLGFPDAVLGVAFPSVRDAFGLAPTGLGQILMAAAIGYIASGLVAGRVIARLGVGNLLVISTALVTGGLYGYAVAPNYAVFLVFAIAIGLGSGAIDAALNFFATENFSDGVMNLLHGFFGVGALIGPIIMGNLLDRGVAWRTGYVVVASILFAMLVIFITTRRLWDAGVQKATPDDAVLAAPFADVLGSPIVWLNVVMFICIAGVEVTSGQWAFTIMRERFGQGEAIASLWSGFFWGALALGRLTLGQFSHKVGAARMVQASIVVVIAGTLLYATGGYVVAVIGLLIVGFGMSTLYPLTMMLTPRRVGRSISVHAIGFQVSAATLGGAVMPWLAGLLSQQWSLRAIPWVIVSIAVVMLLAHTALVRLDRGDRAGQV